MILGDIVTEIKPQKLKTLLSTARSIKAGAPSSFMFEKNFDSST
jgi:hypothetical protein